MKYNRLGNTGLLVSELSFGSWVTFDSRGGDGTIVPAAGQGDRRRLEASAKREAQATEACFEIMVAAYKGGVNFFDNAEAYAQGDAEKLMGRCVRLGIERRVWTREDLVLTTKIMFGAMPPRGSPDFIPHAISLNRVGLSRKHVYEGLRASLRRLQLEYVDVVFCHRPDPVTPMEEVVRAFNHCIDAGLCFYWGTSEWSAADLLRAQAIAERLGLVPPIVEQPEYHIFHRQRVEVEYKPLYHGAAAVGGRSDPGALGLGLTTWSPLASGVLTGKYRGGQFPPGSRLANPDFQKRPDFRSRFLRPVQIAERLRPIAEGELGCTMGQLALAWCLKNPDVSTVITGATSVAQVEENLVAVEVVERLTPEIMRRIDEVIEGGGGGGGEEGGGYVAKEHPVTRQMAYRLRKLSPGALAKL